MHQPASSGAETIVGGWNLVSSPGLFCHWHLNGRPSLIAALVDHGADVLLEEFYCSPDFRAWFLERVTGTSGEGRLSLPGESLEVTGTSFECGMARCGAHGARPFVHSRLTATLDDQGRVTSWTDRLAAQSVVTGTAFETALVKNGVDTQNTEGAEDVPYAIPNVRVDIHQTKYGVPVRWWRSVGHSFNAFAVEVFIDELAHAAGKDPYQFRRDLLKDKPRHLGVLDTAAKAAGWSSKPPKGIHRGIAVHESYGSFVAQVIDVSIGHNDVSIGHNKELNIHRVVSAIDCGIAINPDLVKAQMESTVIFGLSGALFQEVTLRNGVVEQNNFDDYPVLRMHQTPRIEPHIVESNENPSGVGEPGN